MTSLKTLPFVCLREAVLPLGFTLTVSDYFSLCSKTANERSSVIKATKEAGKTVIMQKIKE